MWEEREEEERTFWSAEFFFLRCTYTTKKHLALGIVVTPFPPHLRHLPSPPQPIVSRPTYRSGHEHISFFKKDGNPLDRGQVIVYRSRHQPNIREHILSAVFIVLFAVLQDRDNAELDVFWCHRLSSRQQQKYIRSNRSNITQQNLLSCRIALPDHRPMPWPRIIIKAR